MQFIARQAINRDMKLTNLLLLSSLLITPFITSQAHASGSPVLQCWISGIAVKKWDMKNQKMLDTTYQLAMYFDGLDRREAEDNVTAYPISSEIMMQLDDQKPAKMGPQNTLDLTELNPPNVDTVYGAYTFADTKGVELKDPMLDLDFTSNSGSTLSIHLKGEVKGKMSGNAILGLSAHDANRIQSSVEQKDLRIELPRDKKSVTLPIICEESWS